MKKFLSILLCAIMVCSLMACGGAGTETSSEGSAADSDASYVIGI